MRCSSLTAALPVSGSTGCEAVAAASFFWAAAGSGRLRFLGGWLSEVVAGDAEERDLGEAGGDRLGGEAGGAGTTGAAAMAGSRRAGGAAAAATAGGITGEAGGSCLAGLGRAAALERRATAGPPGCLRITSTRKSIKSRLS